MTVGAGYGQFNENVIQMQRTNELIVYNLSREDTP